MNKTAKTIIGIACLVVAAMLIATFLFFSNGEDVKTSTFFEKAGVVYLDTNDKVLLDLYKSDLENPISYIGEGFIIIGNKSEIDLVVIENYNLKGYKGSKLIYESSYGRNDEFSESVIKGLPSAKITIDYTDPNAGSFFSSLIMPLLMLAMVAFVIIFFSRQMSAGNKGAFDFGKTKSTIITNIKTRFSDVAGAEEEKQELKEIVDFLKNPQKFTMLGAKIPKGVLLVGKPGTGKTLFAKAVAGEAGVPFFSISGSDFVEMFVGVGASRVRDLFNTAKKNQPCIVFIDEIDAVGRQRGAGLGGGNDEREQTLIQLLVQMDGFEANEGIIVMAATNRADVLDPALLRPGRFDRQIYVNLPDVRGREAILKVHSRNKPLAPDVNFKVLARMTSMFSGADLANLLNEAAILAARENRKFITNTDLYEAINKVIMGPQKRSRLVTETDKRMTAYHEAGHAVLARVLPHCDPVQEVSIIPRGSAGGYTLTRPDSDDNYYLKSKLLDDIVMTMGGRAAEEIVIKEVSSGPSSDIKHVTNLARTMVTEFGMNDVIGPVSYGDNAQIFVGRDYQTKAPYSEEIAKTIDMEVGKIINEGYKRAVKLLTENRAILDTMARVLIEKETIYSEEIDMIMSGKSYQEVIELMENSDNKNPLAKEVAKAEKTEEDKSKPQNEIVENAQSSSENIAQEDGENNSKTDGENQ